MNRILLLRVGIDTGCGGTLGPIFPNGTFEYVPIPENSQYMSARSVYYRDLPARRGGKLAQYVPRRYREAAAHYDPEFETFTYGDPNRNKRTQLLRLADGDLLVFYAGLRPVGFHAAGRLYIIGYFTVASAESIDAANSWPPTNAPHLLGNAHLRRNRPDHGLVVVSGHSRRSKLLDRAIPISDEAQCATPEVENRIGIHGSLKRAVGRWVPSEYVANAVDWIVRSEGCQRQMQTLIYKRTHNHDPDPDTGVFGNKNCMKRVRGWLLDGDAVIGVGGIGQEPEQEGIARKLTWAGIGAHKTGNRLRPKVTFDHFLYYGKTGPLLKDLAPAVAKRIYDGGVRLIWDTSLSEEERKEVKRILSFAENAPPSGQLVESAPQRNAQKTSSKCRPAYHARSADQKGRRPAIY
jgi:putative DNA base modification enzyme with NMAD domain